MAVERIASISGRAVPLRGDNIDTDRIIPARFLRSISFEGLENHVFADDRAQAPASKPHPLFDPRFAGASILVVNANFGCGSSREHAPQALRRRGCKALVGESFSEIFFGNSVALGMPCVTAARADVERIMRAVETDPATEVDVSIERQMVAFGEESAPLQIPAAARDAFLDGSWDATGLLLARYDEVERLATHIPYLNGFTRA